MYDPLAVLSTAHPDVIISTTDNLPAGVAGEWVGDTLFLATDLTEVERKSTLAREIAHLEGASDPEASAARCAVDPQALAHGIATTIARSFGQIAGEVQVDTHLLRARLTGLTPDEVAALALDIHALVVEILTPARSAAA